MIAALNLGTVREASTRIEREIPEISRKLEALHEAEAQAERPRDEMIDQTAGVSRRSDDLIEQIRALPDELAVDREALLIHTREVRR